MASIVGRKREKEELDRIFKSPNPELIVVYGRRRVGKTFLIREHFGNQISFEITGLHNEPLKRQLESFANRLASHSGAAKERPTSWIQAFEQLRQHLQFIKSKKRMVIFFDEFPWLATRRSGFLAAFEEFWNTFGSRDSRLVCVICGSAASWMINRVLNSKGGLHNRTTSRILLLPFSLAETNDFLIHNKVKLTKSQITQLYMAVGGIPHYLQRVQRGKSASQNINAMCFQKDSLLAGEFSNLYRALFENSDRHEKVVRALAKKRLGLTRAELANTSALKSGGTLTKVLTELRESGFILEIPALYKLRKESLYRLIDEYSLFYLSWIESNRTTGPNIWQSKSTGQKWKSWCGYAFENLCFRHLSQIKFSLGISGIISEEASWQYVAKNKQEDGAQIDLLIDRSDQCINLCEMKFANAPFSINKKYAGELRQKMRVFQEQAKNNKAIFLTMVTANGVKENQYSVELVSNEIPLSKLFSDI
ncbi:ATP-binding protein [Mariniblastus sp.]|nr:ATP-binding protein [Mariniblastus sp.]